MASFEQTIFFKQRLNRAVAQRLSSVRTANAGASYSERFTWCVITHVTCKSLYYSRNKSPAWQSPANSHYPVLGCEVVTPALSVGRRISEPELTYEAIQPRKHQSKVPIPLNWKQAVQVNSLLARVQLAFRGLRDWRGYTGIQGDSRDPVGSDTNSTGTSP